MKATHIGTCQVCGHSQKLPNDRLALHGYTKAWGFFSGTCPGSRHEPFEVSKALIEGAIKNAQAQIESIREFQTKLLTPATEPKAYVSEYVSGGWKFRGYTTYYEVEILSHENRVPRAGEADYVYQSFSFVSQYTKKPVKIHTYEITPDALTLANRLNGEHASRQDAEIANLQRYIRWQQERIANWAPQPLKEVK